MAWTSPRTWVAGENVTAALMNTHVRDNLKAIGDTWSSYTPSWTATTTNPTIGNGSVTGRYLQAGKWTKYLIVITFGSTTTAGSGTYLLTLPFAPLATARIPIGQVAAFDTSASATKMGGAYWVATSSAIAAKMDGDTQLNQASPYTWATGDTIAVYGDYEAA